MRGNRYSRPMQDYAASIVAASPGCTKLYVAKRVGPHGSLQFGYRTVNRAIRNGLIKADQLSNGRYSLYPPEGSTANDAP